MLLSIDRVLQLLAEGKTIIKIAELADCNSNDVIGIIDSARKLLSKYEKPLSKKKIILRKTKESNKNEQYNEKQNDEIHIKSIFTGAELSAVPLSSSLVFHACGFSNNHNGPSGIGIVIYDQDDHQVGKVSVYIGKTVTNIAIYKAIIRAMQIAIYFKTTVLRVQNDSEYIVNQINGEQGIDDKDIKKLYTEILELTKKIPSCSIEHVTQNFCEKANYLAQKGSNLHKKP